MTVNQRRSVIGIAQVPHGSIDAGDRMQLIPLYRMLGAVAGWVGKLLGIQASSMAKVNNVAYASIKKIRGV